MLTEYKALAGSQLPLTVLVEHVSFIFNTIELDSSGKYESLSTELARREVDMRQLLWAIEHRDFDSPLCITLSLSEGAPSLLPLSFISVELDCFARRCCTEFCVLLEHALGRSRSSITVTQRDVFDHGS